MTSYSRYAIAITCGIALTNCAGMQLESARKASPQGSEFTQGLYAGYIDLSASEYDEADYSDSDWFAGRAISAANDVAVGPEEIGNRNVPADRVRELGAARARLVAALQVGATTKNPTNAARAQVMFDCWIQEQEENRQPDDIAACRDGFIDAIGLVEASLRPAPAPVAAKPAPMKVATPMAKPDPKSWVTYFAFDEANLTQQAMQKISEAAAYSMEFDTVVVTVKGYTDRAGDTEYNKKLSEMRADEVTTAILAKGVPASAIVVRSFGEADPAVQTPDGQPEQYNRRAVITIDYK